MSTNLDLFSYRSTKDGKILIDWNGRTVLILKGAKAQALQARLDNADDLEEQLLLAKITGNFKHGNERVAKQRSRR